MVLRQDAKYALITPTSMGVRITPVNCQSVRVSRLFEMQATSAETNVVNIGASLGLPVKVLTKFVKDSAISDFIRAELRRRGLEFEGAQVEQGGPWGYRHQFNIADSGYGVRGPRVLNDRAGEVGRTLCASDFDIERIFGKEGCQILHLSGLICALSPESSQCCLELARAAKKYGTLISFDVNYRPSFWEGREEQLREVFLEIAQLSDILTGADVLIGDRVGYQPLFEEGAPDEISTEHRIAAVKGMLKKVGAKFPNAGVLTATMREELSANRHLWGAILLFDNEWYVEQLREIEVLDRIGGGDGFMGGLLYGILRQWEPEKWLQFGWACGALAVTVLDDYATPDDEEQLWSIYQGNAKVKR
ncbi:PfkB family carbohydrate kinase [Feifania hominis]|uniref:Sugar kinase n=1 Tax=Feifania hominis TaxID=2763660 RepID=A0A926DA01_9FIRM|nr:PfkB family carbohydrate kinase [Feifania hominis]MBC8535135.1 sugar kinase [Feifania hominis]